MLNSQKGQRAKDNCIFFILNKSDLYYLSVWFILFVCCCIWGALWGTPSHLGWIHLRQGGEEGMEGGAEWGEAIAGDLGRSLLAASKRLHLWALQCPTWQGSYIWTQGKVARFFRSQESSRHPLEEEGEGKRERGIKWGKGWEGGSGGHGGCGCHSEKSVGHLAEPVLDLQNKRDSD